MQKIISWIDSISTDDPVVIMADFNAKPDENSMKLLESAGYGYVKGSNGEILDISANQGINHILFRPLSRWRVIDAGNPAYSASNRNPVWADIELIDPVKVSRTALAAKNNRRTFQIIKGEKSLSYRLYSPASISIVVFSFTGPNLQSSIISEAVEFTRSLLIALTCQMACTTALTASMVFRLLRI